MTGPDRALAPLNAVEASIDKLDTYRTTQELAESLQAIGQAVERSLRQLLRASTTAPDDLRLAALSTEDLPLDRLLIALRRHDLIPLELAGMLHELEQVRTRAETGDVRAADADTARRTVDTLQSHLRTPAQSHNQPHRQTHDDAPVRDVVHAAVARGQLHEEPHAVTSSRHSIAGRSVLPLAIVAGLALLAWASFALLRGHSSDMQDGIVAFGQKDMGTAEEKFRAVLTDDPDNVTARLYLGRVLRVQNRPADAAQMLNAARKLAPEDADVLREMGHAFMDLKKPGPAIEAYRRAQELEPSDARNWVGLVRALRAAGDPSAAEVLKRAPREARTQLENGS
ncbi:MAG TPA: tetratricopeptide repeat protein [Longimicrobiales bacterium]